jgi:hypothetical protein
MTQLTVKQLKALLAQMPDDTLVVLASDAEGNAFSPVGGYTETARYIPGYRPWLPGDIYTQDDPKFESQPGQHAFVLWPSH